MDWKCVDDLPEKERKSAALVVRRAHVTMAFLYHVQERRRPPAVVGTTGRCGSERCSSVPGGRIVISPRWVPGRSRGPSPPRVPAVGRLRYGPDDMHHIPDTVTMMERYAAGTMFLPGERGAVAWD